MHSTTGSMELGTPFLSNKPVVIAPNVSPSVYFMPGGNVGLGTSAPTDRLHVNGNINLTGVLKVNGSSGTAGQVLTSNGGGDPQWKNAAFNNTTRFAMSFTKNPSFINDDAVIDVVRYNLNPADINIGSSTITINRSGLYHFDLHVKAVITFSSSQTVFPRFNCWLFTGARHAYEFVDGRIMQAFSTTNQSFGLDDKESLEVYITAPATMSLFYGFGVSGGTDNLVAGYLAGYLISE